MMNRLLLLCCLVFSPCVFAAEDRASHIEELADLNNSFTSSTLRLLIPCMAVRTLGPSGLTPMLHWMTAVA
jgi:hypothetical protein